MLTRRAGMIILRQNESLLRLSSASPPPSECRRRRRGRREFVDHPSAMAAERIRELQYVRTLDDVNTDVLSRSSEFPYLPIRTQSSSLGRRGNVTEDGD